MIVEYRLKDYQLARVTSVEQLTMYALKNEMVIRYIKQGRSGQITIQTARIEYLEVRPD